MIIVEYVNYTLKYFTRKKRKPAQQVIRCNSGFKLVDSLKIPFVIYSGLLITDNAHHTTIKKYDIILRYQTYN